MDTFFNSLELKSFGKKEFLLKKGQHCYSHYFIIKGCLRFFFTDQKGKEQTVQLGMDNWWVTDYDSFINGNPSNLNIQTIETCDILILPKHTLETLYKTIPALERLFRIIAEKSYIASLKRTQFLQTLSSEERYYNLVNSFPQVRERIPQYIIASYLGISPEYLSTIQSNK